ncbi:hypothetical protein [Ekhidna sp.]|uniref:hypothetical protein n=1 Tax=Ekhidna sp. TaxID=2608089 RepID=UPI003C7CF70B
MRNILAIQYLAILLCVTMVGEIPIEYGDLISIEIDTEKEQEENTEKEKEKTTGQEYNLNDKEGLTIALKFSTRDQQSDWNSPSIDLHTPPPEQL